MPTSAGKRRRGDGAAASEADGISPATSASTEPATSASTEPATSTSTAPATSTSTEPATSASTAPDASSTLVCLERAYAAIDGYALARAEKAAQRAAGVYLDSIQYGEVAPLSFARCLEWVAPRAGEAFFDLGSGTGKAVLTAALLHPFSSATGIEIQRSLHDAALQARESCTRVRAARVSLECGDAFAADAAWPEEAGVLFCTTTCFTPELRAALSAGVQRMRAGARVIVTTQGLEGVPRLRLLRREAMAYAKGSLQFWAYEVVP